MAGKVVCLIVGAGPGNGLAIARKFGINGFKIILASRREGERNALLGELHAGGIEAEGLPLDCEDPDAVLSAVSKLGAIEALVYNAAGVTMATPTSLQPGRLIRDLSISAVSALAAAQAVSPGMKTRGRGTILMTGGGFALKPAAAMASLGMGKAAIRNLTFALADELRPAGIRIGTVTILGMVGPGTPFDPSKIADVFWSLHEDRAYELGVEVQFTGLA